MARRPIACPPKKRPEPAPRTKDPKIARSPSMVAGPGAGPRVAKARQNREPAVKVNARPNAEKNKVVIYSYTWTHFCCWRIAGHGTPETVHEKNR